MRGARIEVVTTVLASLIGSVSGAWRTSRAASDDLKQLQAGLSSRADIYFPGTPEFKAASARWSVLEAPTPNVVVVPATEEDVALTVRLANKFNIPVLAFNGAHGAITTLGAFDYGIEIYLNRLSSVAVSKDGRAATIGGGTLSVNVTNALWAAGKQTVTGTCECVSYLGPALGGGHGWLQGQHGLIADQFISLNVVLANGTLVTVDRSSELFWALKGAGHNFGIVTSATVKVFDIVSPKWAIETIIFSGDQVEAVYDAANKFILKNGTRNAGLINWSYWLNIPPIDPKKPVLLFYMLQEGVTTVDPAYTKALHDLKPISITPETGTYKDLARWTLINLEAAPCQKAGLVNPRFPLYLQTYNVTAQKKAYDRFASAVGGSSVFNSSIFMFENYESAAVKAVAAESTAFAHRASNILSAPLITYLPTNTTRDQQAAAIGNELREVLYAGSGEKDHHVYLNYAYGNEGPKDWYGSEDWRQQRLRALKKKYDPKSQFSYYGPIA